MYYLVILLRLSLYTLSSMSHHSGPILKAHELKKEPQQPNLESYTKMALFEVKRRAKNLECMEGSLEASH